MAPNQPAANPYADERRNGGPYDSYRPGTRDRPPPFRRDSRGPRGNGPPHIDTSVRAPEGPRNWSNNSPASALDQPNHELNFKRMDVASQKLVTSSSTASGPPTPVIPKAKNPDLQEAFENAYRWGEASNKRLLLSMRKTKTGQENRQRRLENEHFAAKAPEYPAYVGLSEKLNLVDRGLDDQLKAVEDNYSAELEQLIARLMTAAKPAATSRKDPIIMALEAKVENISRLMDTQAQQIQDLRRENENFQSSIMTLETGYKSIETCHNDLKSKYSALKLDHDALKSKSRGSDDAIHALQLHQDHIDSSNKALKKQCEDLRSTTEKASGSSQAQVIEDRKTLRTVLERIKSIEVKLDEFKEFETKVEEIDFVTLNEIFDAWVLTEHNLKTLHEEYIQRHTQPGSLADHTVQPPRQEMDSLRTGLSTLDLGTGTALPTEALDAIISSRIEDATNNMKKNEDARDDFVGQMIDEVTQKVDDLKKSLADPETGMIARITARIEQLEQWKVISSPLIQKAQTQNQNQNQTPNLNLAELARSENQTIGLRVERIDHDVGCLNQKYEVLKGEVGKLVSREWVDLRLNELLASSGLNTGVAEEMKELRRELLTVGAIEQAVKTLEWQFQNLSTKKLAEHIVRLTSPALEQRLVKVENLTVGNKRILAQHDDRLSSINNLLRSFLPTEKRTASPSQAGDEPNKKRKLEVNGRQPSPLQRQQQQPQTQTQTQTQPQPHPQQQRNSPVQNPSS
ncbi:hypothetical protein F5Y14DRAFT_296863 [Nemania sp. NC0429]|nr:hypothetical protein F5Y14DRAFT_296863 [Nemania sp. NC0429]